MTKRTSNRLLWTAQTLTAALFLFAGSTKFIMSPEQLQQGPMALPLGFLYFIGICECLGALGLILPGVLRIQTWLTPLAAGGLTIIMIGATTISIPTGIGAAFPGVVGIITAWIAYSRTRVAPIHEGSRAVLRAA